MNSGQRHLTRPKRSLCWSIAALSIGAVIGAAALAAAPQHYISQKDQIFTPGELSIKRGETVEIVNDDGDLLHHLYIASKKLDYDSGDQEPGAKVDITFPYTGTFDVLCGIHPKMKLTVHVE